MKIKMGTVIAFTLVSMCLVSVAMAAPAVVTVTFKEDSMRYYPDGTSYPYLNDPYSIEFLMIGKTFYRDAWWYNIPPSDLRTSKVVVSSCIEVGWATYTSPRTGLPIRDRLVGNIGIYQLAEGSYTMRGSYMQYTYTYGDEATVHSWYPSAIKTGISGMWLVCWTHYSVHS